MITFRKAVILDKLVYEISGDFFDEAGRTSSQRLLPIHISAPLHQASKLWTDRLGITGSHNIEQIRHQNFVSIKLPICFHRKYLLYSSSSVESLVR